MKYLILLLLFVYGCTSTVNETPVTGAVVDMIPPEPMHTGCQEGEIKIDGTCTVAAQNNAMLFGQDFTSNVVTQELADGFIAKPKAEGNYPGVVMIHEWWGLNDNIREMARILANEGYVVYAVDLYDGEVAADSSRARELSAGVREKPEKAIARMKSAVVYLKNAEGVDKVASLGWCFGGGQSLQLSLNEGIDATIIYYGQLTDDKIQLAKLEGPVLGIFGSEDQSIPVQSVRAFGSSLDSLGIENKIIVYDGVGHAFANPSGANYAPDETIDAWKRTIAFLDESLPVEEKPVLIQQEVTPPVPDVKVFNMKGMNYNFILDNAKNPTLIVNQGDRVRIELTIEEGMHDLVIDGIGKTGIARAGQTVSFEFSANKPGAYEYYCSVSSHRERGMEGRIIVQ